MKILISNDDGILAPGLCALAQAFGEAGHEVVVSAPDRQRSAASHSLTIGRPLTVQEAHVPGALRAYAVSGTPADCVKLGLHKLFPEAEYVVSGINHGYNAGSDVLYSGTVAAAMEGALEGRHAMAVSLAESREDTYPQAAQMALAVFGRLLSHPLPPLCVLNLNYPKVDRALGIRVAPLRRIHYFDEYVQDPDGPQGRCYRLTGCANEDVEEGEDDFTWLRRGYATVTALGFDMTAYAATDALRALF